MALILLLWRNQKILKNIWKFSFQNLFHKFQAWAHLGATLPRQNSTFSCFQSNHFCYTCLMLFLYTYFVNKNIFLVFRKWLCRNCQVFFMASFFHTNVQFMPWLGLIKAAKVAFLTQILNKTGLYFERLDTEKVNFSVFLNKRAWIAWNGGVTPPLTLLMTIATLLVKSEVLQVRGYF